MKEFKAANNVILRVMKKRRWEGRDTAEHRPVVMRK